MSKWDKWYENQNPTTRAWLDAQSKEIDQFALAIGLPAFFLGLTFGFIFGLGI